MSKFCIIAEILFNYIHLYDRYTKNKLIFNDLLKEFSFIENYKNLFDFNIYNSIKDWEDILNKIENIENRNKIINNIINEQ